MSQGEMASNCARGGSDKISRKKHWKRGKAFEQISWGADGVTTSGSAPEASECGTCGYDFGVVMMVLGWWLD